MNLYLLTRTGYVGYDENDSAIVRAPTSAAARKFASVTLHGDETPNEWLDSLKSTCVKIGVSNEEGEDCEIILRSFNAG